VRNGILVAFFLVSTLTGCPSPNTQASGDSATLASHDLKAAFESVPSGHSSGGARLKAGMSRAEVETLAGVASTKQEGTLPTGSFSGPQEGLDAKQLDASRAYEEWQYTHDGNTYYLWFGDPKLPKAEWKLIAVGVYPANAAF
jgi:hypothetical protein